MLSERRDGHIVVLSIDRPEARNALSRELVERLTNAIDGASCDDSASAVVLAAVAHGQGRERVFVAGGDLHELAQLPMDAAGADRVLELGQLARAIEACAVPVIAAVSGAALGGGAELVIACDLVVMDANATIRFLHAKMGLTPAWGGTTRLTERVGTARASELLMTARAIGADEALRLGLCNRVTASADAEAMRLAGELATIPRATLALLKRSLAGSRDARRSDAFLAEQKVFRSAWGSDAHRAALAAFLQKGA
jgi:enoyl-CoA hydratase